MKHLAFFGLLLIANVVWASKSFVGLANVYIYPQDQVRIAIEFPLDFDGVLVNWSQAGFQNFPDYFLIGDGTTKRNFILVDKRAGSALRRTLGEIQTQILRHYRATTLNEVTEEQVLGYLVQHTQSFIQWKNTAEAHEAIQFSAVSQYANELNGLPIGQWFETKVQNEVTPFTDILKEGEGVCIDMALLASFVLEAFHIPHQVVFGSVQNNDFDGGGHTWIQLKDGRLLDVAWKTLDHPAKQWHPKNEDWLWFGNRLGYQYRFPYLFFPLINLDRPTP